MSRCAHSWCRKARSPGLFSPGIAWFQGRRPCRSVRPCVQSLAARAGSLAPQQYVRVRRRHFVAPTPPDHRKHQDRAHRECLTEGAGVRLHDLHVAGTNAAHNPIRSAHRPPVSVAPRVGPRHVTGDRVVAHPFNQFDHDDILIGLKADIRIHLHRGMWAVLGGGGLSSRRSLSSPPHGDSGRGRASQLSAF